jgi:hypothetical protein
MVGAHGTAYPNYRPLTRADWRDAATAARLIAAHQQHGGWPLLQTPLRCHGPLCVAEGFAQVNLEMGF